MLKSYKILASWVVVLGVTSLMALPALAQNHPTHKGYRLINSTTPNQTRITPSPRLVDPAGRATNSISGVVTYPYGSRVYTDGTVMMPRGQVVPPAVTINRGDGSTTYYYPDGSHIDTNRSTIPPMGTPIR